MFKEALITILSTKLFISLAIVIGGFVFQYIICSISFKKAISYYERTNKNGRKIILNAFMMPFKIFLIVMSGLIAIIYYFSIPVNSSAFNTVKLLRTIVILFIFLGTCNIVSEFNQNPESIKIFFKIKIENLIVPFLCSIAKALLIFIMFAVVVYQWGYDITGFITGLGIGSLAIALGAKDTIGNIFGGIFISLDKPFSIGDWISTQDNLEGIVEDINFRSTKIRTFDKGLIYIPNSLLSKQAIYNWTRRDMRLVKFQICVSPDTTEKTLKSFIKKTTDLILQHSGIENELVYVAFQAFSSNSSDIIISYYTNTPKYDEYLKIVEEINFGIKEIIETEHIYMAHPVQNVIIKTNEL